MSCNNNKKGRCGCCTPGETVQLVHKQITPVPPKTLYEDALAHGFIGSFEDFLETQVGPSAYEIAVQEGFEGTVEEWLESLEGEPGEAATITIGTVTTLEPEEPATVTNTGTPEAAEFNFGIPQGEPGEAATITVGSVATVPPGTFVTVVNSGSSSEAVFDFGIPQGEPGEAATITIGTVTTLPAGDPATVVNSGSSSEAVLDFGIPQGEDGDGAPNPRTLGALRNYGTEGWESGNGTDQLLEGTFPEEPFSPVYQIELKGYMEGGESGVVTLEVLLGSGGPQASIPICVKGVGEDTPISFSFSCDIVSAGGDEYTCVYHSSYAPSPETFSQEQGVENFEVVGANFPIVINAVKTNNPLEGGGVVFTSLLFKAIDEDWPD